MKYKVIIAEKPSVAGAIAKIVGATTPHRKGPTGYLEGGGYRVTWAFGHLVGLMTPEQMGYTTGQLPMFPDRWTTRVLGRRVNGKETADPMVDAQMSTITTLFGGADEIIVATDAGREGELIFRYIYEHIDCHTYFTRLWISSLTDEAIRTGMKEIRPGHEFDALSDAAHARSQADWLVGFNASRALRLATGFRGNLSLGRVQTPTLGMICRRDEQFRNFVPTPFWQVIVDAEKKSTAFKAASEIKYNSEDKAAADLARTKAAKQLRVENVEKKHLSTRPPLLYDLTELQRTANGRYGMTADQTLKLAQSLYEKKIITYPRTGSRYIPEDVFRTIPGLLSKLESNKDYGSHAKYLSGKKLCRRSVDDSKVTDHHALLPTGVAPADISSQEKKIYDLVATRMIEAFGENSESDVTNVTMDAGGVKFKAHGSVVTHAGWKAVNGVQEKDESKDDEDDGLLPELKTGDLVTMNKAEVVRKTDKPLPQYTEKSLLGDMTTCGKTIEDEEAREAMKDVGLGTPATRASIIEALITREYVQRDGKKLLPTALGMQVWKMVEGRKIGDVQTTGEWERDLAYVEKGSLSVKVFMKNIKAFVEELINDIQANCKPLENTEKVYKCPCCGNQMRSLKYSISCLPEAGGCGFKIGREICGKKLPASAIDALAAGKTTETIKGFTSQKTGKRFDAPLKVDKEKRVVSFAINDTPSALQNIVMKCPCCDNEMKVDGGKASCECGFTMWFRQYGATLTQKQIQNLLAGGKTAVHGMKSLKTGKHFDAYLQVDKEKKTIGIVDFINTAKTKK